MNAKPEKHDLSLKRVVDAIRPRAARYFVWDSARAGLGLDVWPSGKRSWVYQYVKDGVQRRMKLGDANAMPPGEADRQLTARKHELHRGSDPLALRKLTRPSAHARRLAAIAAQRIADAERRATSTVADVAALYLATLALEKSARWHAEAARIVKQNIPSALAATAIRDVTVAQIRAIKESMAARPIAANRTLAVLSAICSRAIKDGDRPHELLNPAASVTPYAEISRDRYLTTLEWPRMAAAIAALRDALTTEQATDTRRSQFDALLTLALTGARLGAVLPRQWADLDADERTLRVLPAHKGVTSIALGKTALAHLLAIQSRPDAHPVWLFPGVKPGRRRATAPWPAVKSLNGVWNALRTAAGVEDMTLHDWRRTFATVAGDVGVSDHMIGGLLGHSVPGIRGRYARRTDAALLAAADLVSAEVARRLQLNIEAE